MTSRRDFLKLSAIAGGSVLLPGQIGPGFKRPLAGGGAAGRRLAVDEPLVGKKTDYFEQTSERAGVTVSEARP
jgi:TAT (twin-arginine translocation) pathway signal sequence